MLNSDNLVFNSIYELTDALDNSKELSDVKLVKYKHMGKIPMPIAQ